MVIVQGFARFHGDDMEAFRRAAAAMIPATRAEPGCLHYAYGEDLFDSGLVHVSELWAGEAAMNQHLATPHMAALGNALGALRVLEMQITAYDAANGRLIMRG